MSEGGYYGGNPLMGGNDKIGSLVEGGRRRRRRGSRRGSRGT